MATIYKVSVKDLISAGFLTAGQKIFPTRQSLSQESAVINADGLITYQGKNFASLSGVAKTVAGTKAEPGWDFWKTITLAGEKTLFEIRAEYLSQGTHNLERVEIEVEEQPPILNPEETESAGVISSFGMFWRRNQVDWRKKSNTNIFGSHPQKPELKVDMAGQVGVYLLHDGARTVYVGRVSQKRLGLRLYEHTIDRLSGRWDRFSWFGLRPVDESGQLGLVTDTFPAELVVSTMEALLIEGLEPPQNRRQGDGMTGQEYLQVLAPEIEQEKIKNKVLDLLSS